MQRRQGLSDLCPEYGPGSSHYKHLQVHRTAAYLRPYITWQPAAAGMLGSSDGIELLVKWRSRVGASEQGAPEARTGAGVGKGNHQQAPRHLRQAAPGRRPTAAGRRRRRRLAGAAPPPPAPRPAPPRPRPRPPAPGTPQPPFAALESAHPRQSECAVTPLERRHASHDYRQPEKSDDTCGEARFCARISRSEASILHNSYAKSRARAACPFLPRVEAPFCSQRIGAKALSKRWCAQPCASPLTIRHGDGGGRRRLRRPALLRPRTQEVPQRGPHRAQSRPQRRHGPQRPRIQQPPRRSGQDPPGAQPRGQPLRAPRGPLPCALDDSSG